MSLLHMLREELRPYLEAATLPPLSAENIHVARPSPEDLPLAPSTPNLEVSERYISGSADQPDVRVLLYRPTDVSHPVPAILHVHGGGYVGGSPESFDLENRPVASRLGFVVVSVDYRLAPETPFPGPLEDCYTALTWLYTNAAELGVDPARIAIKGESAGGGLAAGLALLARDRREVPVTFLCLASPMIDDREPTDLHPYADEFTWSPENNRFGWQSYLGQEPGGSVSPYAAAARAEDLTGLPPTWITTSDLDLFFEHNLEFARRLAKACVPVELMAYSGAYHGFPQAGETEIGRRYFRDVREALARALLDPANADSLTR